jgi:hypothetical protein
MEENRMSIWLDRKDPMILSALKQDHSHNHGAEISTESILKGMENLERMPEMIKFDATIKEEIEKWEGSQR